MFLYNQTHICHIHWKDNIMYILLRTMNKCSVKTCHKFINCPGLGFPPIGITFPPKIAPPTEYTVKKFINLFRNAYILTQHYYVKNLKKLFSSLFVYRKITTFHPSYCIVHKNVKTRKFCEKL
jgi:hypothetical protein